MMSPRKVYLDQLLRIPASGHYKCINSFYKYFFVNVQQVLNPRLGSKRGFDDILGLYFDLCPGSRVQGPGSRVQGPGLYDYMII